MTSDSDIGSTTIRVRGKSKKKGTKGTLPPPVRMYSTTVCMYRRRPYLLNQVKKEKMEKKNPTSQLTFRPSKYTPHQPVRQRPRQGPLTLTRPNPAAHPDPSSLLDPPAAMISGHGANADSLSCLLSAFLSSQPCTSVVPDRTCSK